MVVLENVYSVRTGQVHLNKSLALYSFLEFSKKTILRTQIYLYISEGLRTSPCCMSVVMHPLKGTEQLSCSR